MSERKHSRFAPSSLERILACPRSVLLTDAIGAVGTSSKYAAEGSVAHTVAEAYLRSEQPAAVGEVVEYEGHAILVDDAVHEHGKAYAAYVRALLRENYHGVLFVEETVRLDEVVGPDADMYGHLDAAVWHPTSGVLHIIDYKYGAGVRVEPFDNPQLKAYALGAMYSLGIAPGAVRTVKLHVYQPRMNNIEHDTIPAIDLLIWGAEVLAPTITAILQNDVRNEYTTGDHCRWCPALAHCPAIRERANRAAQAAFASPDATPRALSTAELADVLDEIDVIEPWLDAAREEAKRRAIEDHDIAPRYKLVEGRSSRVWRGDVTTLPPRLRKLGLKKADIFTDPAIRSVAQIETRLKKLKTARLDLFGELWEKKSGAPSLVKETNPRPSVRAETAQDVFARAPAPPTDLY